MKLIWIAILFQMTSCNTLPQLYQAAEDIANDDCLILKIDKDAFQKQTDVTVNIEIKNNNT